MSDGPESLRALVRREYADRRRLGELISGIKVHSKTKVSLWLAGKYKGNNAILERDIRMFLSRSQLSRRDERLLIDIRSILDSADNAHAIIATLAASVE